MESVDFDYSLWIDFHYFYCEIDITNYDICICIDLLSECTFQIDINNINHDNDYDSDASTIPYAESNVDSNMESDIESDEGYYSNASETWH